MTAPKLPEGLEPVAWRVDWPLDLIDAIAPERFYDASDAHRMNCHLSYVQGVGPVPEPLYTATQMREAILAATERAAKLDGAVIAAYALPAPDGRQIDEIRIERARQMDGGALWAVRFRGDVLNKNGEWEWEPMPSGRDEDFLTRARFDIAEEAIAAAIRAAAASTGRGEGGEGA